MIKNNLKITMRKLLILYILLIPINVLSQIKVSTKEAKKIIRNNDIKQIDSLLMLGFDINTKFRGKNTLIHYACYGENYEMVKCLIEKGIDLNQQNNMLKDTPLLISTSSSYRNDSISELLINKGANLDIVASYGSNALRNTISFYNENGPNVRIFKLLIENGVDINYYCEKCCNKTAFHYTCVWGVPEMLDILIKENIDINQLDCKGRNGLMYALMGEKIDNIKFLLNTNIDLKQKDEKGRTIIDYAIETKNEEIIKLIKKKTN